MVLLSLGTFSSAKAGTTLAYELTPMSSSSGTYTATFTPILAYDSPTGSYQLVVVESYNGYLVCPRHEQSVMASPPSIRTSPNSPLTH